MKLPEKGTEGVFVVHAHRARRFHWDLRLEVPAEEEDFLKINLSSYKALGIDVRKRETVMWSFAIPKAKTPEGKEKLLAIETEPHPVEYNSFEGKIPEGMYGAGEVKIYDSGKVRWIDVSPKKVVFNLDGEKIKGKFVLLLLKSKKDDRKENQKEGKKKDDDDNNEEDGRKWLWLRVGQGS